MNTSSNNQFHAINGQNHPHERYTLEKAYQEVGEFGPMQKLLAFAMSIVRQQGSLIRYCFSFITLQQVYLCATNGSMNFLECSNQQVDVLCGRQASVGQLDYRID